MPEPITYQQPHSINAEQYARIVAKQYEPDYPVRELTEEEWAAYLDEQEKKQFDA